MRRAEASSPRSRASPSSSTTSSARPRSAACASAASSPSPSQRDRDQRARLRGLRRLRRRSPTACRCCRSRPSSAARRRSTRRPATRTTPASRATARRSSRSIPGKAGQEDRAVPPADLPAPELVVPADDATLRMIGIGGTGVVTVAQIVGMAALLDGKQTRGLDQTGLAQKGGPVVSDVRIFARRRRGLQQGRRRPASTPTSASTCSAPPARRTCFTADPRARRSPSSPPARSRPARWSSTPSVRFAELDRSLDVIEPPHARGRQRLLRRPGALRGAVRRPHADQHAAARRRLAARPDPAVAGRDRAGDPAQRRRRREDARRLPLGPRRRRRARRRRRRPPASSCRRPEVAAAGRARSSPASARRPAPSSSGCSRSASPSWSPTRTRAYARRYADFVRVACSSAEPRRPHRGHRGGRRGLHKLMAYKDEYEVARLHLDPVERARIAAEFGEGAKIRYKLHPPVLRALGLDTKLTLGPWFDPAFRAAAAHEAPARHEARPVRPRRRCAASSARCRASTASWSSARWRAWRRRTYDTRRRAVRRCPTSSAATRTSSCATSRRSATRAAELLERIEGDAASPLVVVHHG